MRWKYRILVVLCVALLVALPRLGLRQTPVIEVWQSDLTSLQEIGLDTASQMSRQLTGLSAALLGGLWIVVAGDKPGRMFGLRDKRRAIWTAVLAGISIYCGFAFQEEIEWMLTNDFYNMTFPIISITRVIQELTFLGAIALLADGAIASLNRD